MSSISSTWGDWNKIKHRKNEDTDTYTKKQASASVHTHKYSLIHTQLDKHFCQMSQLFLDFYNKSRKEKHLI